MDLAAERRKADAALGGERLAHPNALRLIFRRLGDEGWGVGAYQKSLYLPNICFNLFFSSSSNSLN